LVPLGDPALAPKLTLPLSVDIIHHPSELVSKSTAIHARIICPDNVKLHEYPNFPDYNTDDTVLLFPSKNSCSVNDVDISKLKKVVFIDCQWQKTRRMMNDPRLSKLQQVKINLHKTLFWRYQSYGEGCLATIEAVHYFFKEYHEKANNGKYDGEYDNLLYYYSLFYNIIQNHYKTIQKVFPRIENYIKE